MSLTDNISQLLLVDEATQELNTKATTTTTNTLKYQIHPVVALNILDHYSRRSQEQSRVIGALLGEYKEGFIEIKNCFPVRHTETEEEVTVDIEFYRTMYDLHHRVYPNDVVIGWYATGSDVTDDDLLIHEVFHKNIKTNPIFLLVETNVLGKDNKYKGMPIKGFMNRPLVVRDKVIASQFRRIKLSYTNVESEKIGVNTLIRKQKQEANPSNSTEKNIINAIGEIDQLEMSIAKLSEILGDVNSYVQKVISGKIPGDSSIGRFLSEALDSVPKISNDQFEKDFNGHLQDLLMVIYLSNLMRTQLTIAEKLTTSL